MIDAALMKQKYYHPHVISNFRDFFSDMYTRVTKESDNYPYEKKKGPKY